MTELEKAKRLLELFIQYKVHFQYGLCGFLIRIYDFSIIKVEEYYVLDKFIEIHNPRRVKTRVWYSLFRKTTNTAYYFERGSYWRRLRWLKSLVKKYKKIELNAKTL